MKGFAVGAAHPRYRDGSRSRGGPSGTAPGQGEPHASAGPAGGRQAAGAAVQEIGEWLVDGTYTAAEALRDVRAVLEPLLSTAHDSAAVAGAAAADAGSAAKRPRGGDGVVAGPAATTFAVPVTPAGARARGASAGESPGVYSSLTSPSLAVPVTPAGARACTMSAGESPGVYSSLTSPSLAVPSSLTSPPQVLCTCRVLSRACAPALWLLSGA